MECSSGEQLAELPPVEGPNATFFQDFGHPDDPESWLHNSELLVVRHALSGENEFWSKNPSADRLGALTDEIIYEKLFDCHLAEQGVSQARLLQPLANQFEFPNNVVYSSPLRRTVETLCNALDSHPQKGELTIVLLPLAREVLSSFGNVPLLVRDLKRELAEYAVREKGFKAVNFDHLLDDNLWYLRAIQPTDPALKESFLERVGQVADGDHVPVIKQLCWDRRDQGAQGEDAVCLENYTEVFLRSVELKKQLSGIVQATQASAGPLTGRKKIFLLTHSRTIRAFASTEGVNPERPTHYLGSFFCGNTVTTPFKHVAGAQDAALFVHNRTWPLQTQAEIK